MWIIPHKIKGDMVTHGDTIKNWVSGKFNTQGRYSQRQSLGSLIPDLIKDDSFVLISSLSGPNDLDEESCSLIGCYGGQACDSSQ
jgi:hypothetical protein